MRAGWREEGCGFDSDIATSVGVLVSLVGAGSGVEHSVSTTVVTNRALI